MDVDENTAAARMEYEGDTYLFCSEECKDKFAADPESFVSRKQSSSS
jgi:Cu+-exporting ATPase